MAEVFDVFRTMPSVETFDGKLAAMGARISPNIPVLFGMFLVSGTCVTIKF